MCGILFTQIIRMVQLDEAHCKATDYFRHPIHAQGEPVEDEGVVEEPMSMLLPKEDEWWQLMPPLFERSDADPEIDPVNHPDYANWCVNRSALRTPCRENA